MAVDPVWEITLHHHPSRLLDPRNRCSPTIAAYSHLRRIRRQAESTCRKELPGRRTQHTCIASPAVTNLRTFLQLASKHLDQAADGMASQSRQPKTREAEPSRVRTKSSCCRDFLSVQNRPRTMKAAIISQRHLDKYGHAGHHTSTADFTRLPFTRQLSRYQRLLEYGNTVTIFKTFHPQQEHPRLSPARPTDKPF